MNATGRRSNLIRVLLPLALTLFSTGCAYYARPVPAYYRSYETRREITVQTGVVESVRTVLLEGPVTGAGAISGSILGGAAGHAIGHGGHNVGAATVVGAVVGSLIGSAMEQDASRREGVEILVQMDDGRAVAFIQDAGGEWFQPGDRVRVLTDPYSGPRLSH